MYSHNSHLSTLKLSYEYPGYLDEYYRHLGAYHSSELPYIFSEVSSVANHTQGDTVLTVKRMSWWVTSGNRLHFLRKLAGKGMMMVLEEQGKYDG
jgi:hypothetical protein